MIKKHYGEKMMHLCRSLFPTILEKQGLLYSIITKRFYPSKFLYEDIINNNLQDNFYSIIFSQYEKMISKNEDNCNRCKTKNKTPSELLKEKGYTLFQCNSEDDIKSFKKYYSQGEELCTFNGGRLNNFFVFFAIKDNVDEIRRENFKKPKRQDKYGTSVLSIQFSRGSVNNVSIKNRYNHTVSDPDATFSNNLDNIIEGLTDSFIKTYNLNIDIDLYNVEMPGYVIANDGRYYKYNYEYANYYMCPDNIIIKDYTPIYYDKSRYIFFDKYVLDMHNKKINTFYNETDSFINSVGKINKVELVKNEDRKKRKIIINNNTIIIINTKAELLEYYNSDMTKMDKYFLENNKTLEVLYTPNVIDISYGCLKKNENLKIINCDSVEEIGNDFLMMNREIKKIALPKVRKIGDNFMYYNDNIEYIYLPNLEDVGYNFIFYCYSLRHLYLPNLRTIGSKYAVTNKYVQDYIKLVINSDDSTEIYQSGFIKTLKIMANNNNKLNN